jgi:hypothetical protein
MAARAFRHRPALSDLPKGAERELIEQFRDIETNLDDLRGPGVSATPVLRVRSYAPKLGELVLLEPPPEGTLVMIPQGAPENITKSIRIAVVGGTLSPGVTVSIVGRKGTINGQQTLNLTSLCLAELVSVGARGWFSCCAGGGGGGGGAEAAYPIGSLYLSTNSTNPATTLGFGTWAAFGAGRVPVGFNGADADFNTDEGTGGAKTVAAAGSNSAPTFTGTTNQSTSSNSAGTPAGTNSAPTFTGAAIANHSHELPFQKVAGGTGVLRMLAPATFGTGTSRTSESASAAPTANATAAAVLLSQAVSAGTPSGTVSAPTFTGSAMAGHSHTITPSGTVSAPTFTGTPTSVLQPYIVVRMWKRTA